MKIHQDVSLISPTMTVTLKRVINNQVIEKANGKLTHPLSTFKGVDQLIIGVKQIGNSAPLHGRTYPVWQHPLSLRCEGMWTIENIFNTYFQRGWHGFCSSYIATNTRPYGQPWPEQSHLPCRLIERQVDISLSFHLKIHYLRIHRSEEVV